jgi:hypothetical protein
MLKKLSVIAIALTLAGFSSASSAQGLGNGPGQGNPGQGNPGNDNGVGNVGVTVPQMVSVWASTTPTAMTINPTVTSGAAAVVSTIHHMNNIAANISVAVSGLTPGINFYIWDTGLPANNALVATEAVTRQINDYATPTGALAWVTSGGVPLSAVSVPLRNVVKANGGDDFEVIYGANLGPSGIVDAGTYDVTVTYTIVGRPD